MKNITNWSRSCRENHKLQQAALEDKRRSRTATMHGSTNEVENPRAIFFAILVDSIPSWDKTLNP